MIQLSKYGSAVLLADMAYHDSLPKRECISRIILNETKNGYTFKPNPDYPKIDSETKRQKRWEEENKKREFIINYLKEKYPDDNYAQQYEKDNEWNKPLRQHNEDTKRCKFLNSDGRHCDKQRDNTSCYTCCFDCFTPEICEGCNCDFINKDTK